ncbi:MAG: hypothetical protein SVR81_07105 [Chloroflexota bacterium]|nr:hypothetical protein [Chloroflexota bacterium]
MNFNRKKRRLGTIYGLIAGLAFSIAAWGKDGIALATLHVSYAWIKFLPGAMISCLIGGLVGWGSVKIAKSWVALILWIVFGLILVWLIIWVPFVSTPYLLEVLQPGLGEWLNYPMVAHANQLKIIGIIVITLPVFLCGLAEMNTIETVMMSSHSGAILAVILVCSILMGAAGSAGDNLANKQFRDPLQALENLFQFAIAAEDEEVDEVVKRRMRLAVVADLDEVLTKPYRITLVAFDSPRAQMDFLVDFGGTWVKCTTVYSQPVLCEQVFQRPVIISSLNRTAMNQDKGFVVC